MNRTNDLIATAISFILLTGCGSDSTRDHKPEPGEPATHAGLGEGIRGPEQRHVMDTMDEAAQLSASMPAGYTGVLPCADCEGIRHDLVLFADEVFYLRTVYLGKQPETAGGDGADFYDIGRWMLSPEGRVLTLHGYDDDRMFAVISGTVLRMLDRQGRSIESTLKYDLTLTSDLPALEPRRIMRGMYVYMADAGIFEECSTGRRYPVSQEADNTALERAYTEMRLDVGRPLLATLNGRIALRQSMEGDRIEEMIVVEAFDGVWPGETCGPRFSTANLENTYWALVRLADSPVSIPSTGREPHLRLVPGECRVAGHGGCNQIVGSYLLNNGSLEFAGLGLTRRACPDGMKQEQAFLNALESVRAFRIKGEHLELLDEEGDTVARFESRYMM